jgi:signal transduction histidine kinase
MRTSLVRLALAGTLVPLALAGAPLVPVASAAAADEQKKVLVLYSTRRDTQIATVGDREMPLLLQEGLARKPDYYSEYIDGERFPEEQYQDAFRDYLTLKYSSARFDVVIAINNLALEFVASHRDELFADTPIVFITLRPWTQRMTNSTGIIAEPDYRRTLTLALALQPDTTHVFVVVGNSSSDNAMERELRAQFDSFEPRPTIRYLSNMTAEELEQRAAALPEHSIIYYLLFYQDATGLNVNPLEYLDRLAAIANRPMYSWVDSTMNRGVVGGSLTSIESQIAVVAALAVRVLHGERADSIPVSARDLNADQIDWRQLQRWNISEARIPAGTLVRFREPGVWQRYKSYILAASALLFAQTALIAGVLVQRTRRREAEGQVRRSEKELRASYERIHDLGARLISAQEAERARIARELHDDVSQQVALLAIDLELLARGDHDMRGDPPKLAPEVLARAHSIARSVRALSHRLHPAKLRLTGLVAAITGLQRELSQPGLPITFTHENVPPALSNDLTLCLFRIVQEALQNAVKHSGARQVAVHLMASGDGLVLTIGDDGAGFNVDAVWGKGLGLINMVERLEPFGGTMKIRSTPGEGTRLDITVPVQAVQSTETVAM